MVDRVIEMIESSDGQLRVYIVHRPDGCYSFRKQLRTDPNDKGSGKHVRTDGYAEELGWDPPGPYLGIYDSAATAKWEALGRVDWLASTQASN